MAKSKHKSRLAPRTLIIALIVLGTVGYSSYRYLSARSQSDIFLVTEPLTYGDTTLTGIIQKDRPAGVSGNYYLSLANGQVVMLDAQGIDAMIGTTVTVSGNLSPRTPQTSLPYMTVDQLSSL